MIMTKLTHGLSAWCFCFVCASKFSPKFGPEIRQPNSSSVLSQAAAMSLLQTLPNIDQQMETEAQTLEEKGRAH